LIFSSLDVPPSTQSRLDSLQARPEVALPTRAMAQLAILSIAVLGKQGNPLFLRSYSSRRGGENDLKWHYAAHTALDFFDERGELSSLSHPINSLDLNWIAPQRRPRPKLPNPTSVYSTRWKTMQCESTAGALVSEVSGLTIPSRIVTVIKQILGSSSS
jgi:hypothetical protein